jgi:hypothetical protein
MDVVDVAILASMCVLAVFFAYVAVVEWWEARESQQPDAQVIQHPRSDRKFHSAA